MKAEMFNEYLKAGYTPYWILYCMAHGLPIGHIPQDRKLFPEWLLAKHREFDPRKHLDDDKKYFASFIEWPREDLDK